MLGPSAYMPGERFIESTMEDACIIRRDAALTYDDTLDENTGLLVPPSPDAVIVYQGECNVKSPRAGDYKPEIEGGEDLDIEPYKVLLPFKKATNVRYHDIIEVTKAWRDPMMLGMKLRIEGVPKMTHKVYRAVYCMDITNAF